MRSYPVTFCWQEADVIDAHGEVTRVKVMVPKPRYGNVCAKQFVVGEEYPLVILEARSRASHSHYFACIHDAFQNLPDNIAERFPSEEHLRKWCLIERKWFDESEFDCPTEPFAKRLATFIRTEDEYARISVHAVGRAWKVIVRKAKSQSAAAMGRQNFTESKKAVLDLLEHMIGVDRGALAKNAGRAA